MKVLIALLPGQGFDSDFLAKASEGAEQVHIVVVLDQSSLGETAGGAVSSIAGLEELAMESAKYLRKHKKKAEYAVEWGAYSDNIPKRAKQLGVGRVVLQRQPAPFFNELLAGLKKKCTFCGVEVL
ncbi:MAG TPA: hypothetical protein VJI67_00135 [archaeon]|nr:hypothetical protein [archaeon]HLD80514.1 hypothetical protein [archaeon]